MKLRLPWQVVRYPTVHYALVEGWLCQVKVLGGQFRTYQCSLQRIGWAVQAQSSFYKLDEARAWCEREVGLYVKVSSPAQRAEGRERPELTNAG